MDGESIRSANKLGGRTSVGFVLASLHTGASIAAWPGVARAAELADVNLFCFPGGRLGLRAGYEASRNAIYDLAARSPIDGALIWASSLSGAATAVPALDEFVDRYRDIAVASLSSGVSGLPIVTFDYYAGMRDAIVHAATAHGYSRMAFVRGPAGHPGAEERRRAFSDTLRELGLEEDPRLSSSPFPWESGALAARELLDDRGLIPGRDFDVLIVSSDLMALAAIKELQSRGYRVPEDVAILGINNGVESRIAAPPLTTADCPFAELGALGLATVLEAIAARRDGPGAAPPSSRRLKPRLIVRRSCGCPSSSNPPAAGAGRSLEEGIAAEVGLEPERARDWVAPLVESWRDAVRGAGPERFIDLLGRVLDRTAHADMDMGPWQAAISMLRLDALGAVGGSEGSPLRDALEETAGQARILVAEAAERAHAFRAWERDRADLELRELDHELLMALDARRIGEILRRALPGLGIRSAYLCRYEGLESEGPVGASGAASLVAGFRDGQDLDPPPESFPAADLLPREAFPDRRLSYVVEPLFFRDSPIGYALFEIGGATGAIYERLRDSVSNALRSVLLFERVEDARERAERADGIKTRLLTSVTHELRAPVDMILRGTERLLQGGSSLGIGPETAAELERITRGAEHERRLVGDLLDFSRAEIDELDIDRRPIDAEALIREVFGLYASKARPEAPWRLELPERMPVIMADALRLRQILTNLLSNAEKYAGGSSVVLSAHVEPPDLVIRVADGGPGIASDRLPHLFEPFVSQGQGGVGLGLSIARHLALLHFGSLEAGNAPGGPSGGGAVFTLTLPLPDASSLSKAAEGGRTRRDARPCVLLISSSDEAPPEIVATAAARGLSIRRVRIKDTEDGTLDGLEAAAVAWDSSSPSAEEAALFRRLRRRPRLASLPFLLYGGQRAAAAIVDKASGVSSLSEALSLTLPGDGEASQASIVVADDDEASLASLRTALERSFPGAELRTAADGRAAWELLKAKRPLVAVLDISMPGMTGIEVVKRMRADDQLRSVPAILLTSKVISMEDVRAIEASSRVLLGNKGVISDEAAAAEASRIAYGSGCLPAGTSAIVKRSVAFINERYSSSLTRWQVSEAVNASEDYLTRVFRKELGITPWEYLTRLRIERAKDFLASGSDSVALIGARVGFPDQAYFSRVFKKVTGMSPQAYRDSPA